MWLEVRSEDPGRNRKLDEPFREHTNRYWVRDFITVSTPTKLTIHWTSRPHFDHHSYLYLGFIVSVIQADFVDEWSADIHRSALAGSCRMWQPNSIFG